MSRRLLSPLAAVAAIAASLPSLLHPALYRDQAWLVPQARGQDLVTVLAAGVLLLLSGRVDPRRLIVRCGLLGYLVYTFVGAALAYAWNPLFLAYVAALSSSAFALAAEVRAGDPAAIRLDGDAPRRGTAAYLALVATMLTALWLGQIVPALLAGRAPEAVERSGGSLRYVFVLDLGFVVPLAIAGAAGLLRAAPRGPLLAGLVLVKAATMGIALLSMMGFAALAGQPVEAGLAVPWVVLAGSALWTSARLLRHVPTR